MLFVKGWRPLGEITRTVRLRRWRAIAAPELHGEIDLREAMEAAEAEIAAEVWAICAAAPRIGVLLTNGRVIEASPMIVWPSDEHDASNSYLNLTMGTLGSSYHYLTEDAVGHSRYIGPSLALEPFQGLPVLLPDACLAQAKKGFTEAQEATADAPTDTSPAALSRAIVEMHDRGLPMTKRTYRELLAPTRSARAFDMAWRLACEERPDLAKPGRRRLDIETS